MSATEAAIEGGHATPAIAVVPAAPVIAAVPVERACGPCVIPETVGDDPAVDVTGVVVGAEQKRCLRETGRMVASQ